eukprot:TRINITY_DN35799_c0_g1_i1.p1 TRINITY_DN35799_c0_g1~~TRINITY_DN35799_c0_g1_i1.p1  ORF type:complete len:109 (+),score=10.89 TRINITY_DN35799_c0_g1_i1:51-377(+)
MHGTQRLRKEPNGHVFNFLRSVTHGYRRDGEGISFEDLSRQGSGSVCSSDEDASSLSSLVSSSTFLSSPSRSVSSKSTSFVSSHSLPNFPFSSPPTVPWKPDRRHMRA